MTFYKMRWFKHNFCNLVYSRCFKNFFGSTNILLNNPLKMGNKIKKTLRQANSVETISTWNTKMLFCFWLKVYALFIYLSIFKWSHSQRCFNIAKHCDNRRWKWQYCFDVVQSCWKQRWNRQLWFDVVQHCKSIHWRT